MLIMSDIGVATATDICDMLRKKIKEQGITDPSVIKSLMKEIITEMLGEDEGLSLSELLSDEPKPNNNNSNNEEE